MTRRPLIVTLAAAFFGLVLPAQESPRTVTAPSRQELVVTNQNLAVVVEGRTVTLPAGTVTLPWDGAPASARTETWSVTNAREAGVRFVGLVSPLPGQGGGEAEWLAGLVGRSVRIRRPNGETAEAEVVAVHGSTPDHVLFRQGAELVYGEPDARISIASERGAAERATGIRLKLESERAGSRTLTSRYLVSDISWEAAYALSLAPDEKSGRLEGWFVVDNRSGGEFGPTRLRLLAGTLRAAPPPSAPRAMMGRMESQAAMDVVANSAELSESRIYEVPNPPRLPGGRTTFPLAAAAEVAVVKRYVARSQYWMGQMEESQRIPVAVQYRVETKALERALPAGVIRVYADGGNVFTGEDRIEHTAEKTDVEIETSEAFDVAARRRQVSFQQTSRTESEASYEVVLTSRKKEAVTVLVRENFPGDWTIVESSVPAKKLSAFVAEFAVPVPAGRETKLTYRVRVRMRG
jgi:hypothetical protein